MSKKEINVEYDQEYELFSKMNSIKDPPSWRSIDPKEIKKLDRQCQEFFGCPWEEYKNLSEENRNTLLNTYKVDIENGVFKSKQWNHWLKDGSKTKAKKDLIWAKMIGAMKL